MVVIVLFAIASAWTKAVLGATQDPWTTLGSLLWELVGSLAIGGVIGWVLGLYVAKVRAGDTVTLECTLLRALRDVIKVKGVASVDGEMALELTLMAVVRDMEDNGN